MKKTIVFLLAAMSCLLLAGCEESKPKASIRRIEINGDRAQFAGYRLTQNLKGEGVRISEAVEGGKVIAGTSKLEKMEHGVQVFTLDLTDGAGLKIHVVVSNQDVVLGPNFIAKAVDQATDALVRQLAPQQPEQSPPAHAPTPAKPPSSNGAEEHFRTS